MSLDKFGSDEWVSQIAERRRRQNPALLAVTDRWQRLPRYAQFGLLLIIPALLPLLTSNDYILRVAGLVCLYGALALGLNVIVGFAGLLDLGYVAFFGMGGYAYAILSSTHFGIHWPTLLSLPFVTALVALMGLLLGSPSLRLQGDYLAIVTLGFGQIFVQLVNTMNRVSVPWSDQPFDLTGGPNGIPEIDRLHFLGLSAQSVTHYYYVLLIVLALMLILIYNMNRSRLGRAWRAIREDSLAAEAMGIPTDRLRLLAFAIGAGIAGFCGAIFAAWQQSVFPNNFDVDLLITLYAMVVLGGVGSLPGMVAGAFVITVLPEILRPGQQLAGFEVAQIAFYGGVLAFLWLTTRPRRRLIPIFGALIIGGLAVRALAGLLLPPETIAALPVSGTGNLLRAWLVISAVTRDATLLGNLAFFAVVALLILLTRLPQNIRPILLVITLYLLALVWETRLSQEPSTTRLLITGAALVILMNYRPQGLFGQRRVEVV